MKSALISPPKLVKSDYQLLVFKKRPPVEEIIKANKNENAYPISYLFCIKNKGSSPNPNQKSYKQVMRVDWPAILLADAPRPSLASLGGIIDRSSGSPLSFEIFNEYFFSSSYPRVEFLVDSLLREAHQADRMGLGELVTFGRLTNLMVFVASYDIKNSTPAEKFVCKHNHFHSLYSFDPKNATILQPFHAYPYDKWRDALSQDFVALCQDYLKQNPPSKRA